MDIDSKRVRSESDLNEDRLSSLPDELIHKILYRFDTKFAVQTCVLSSRWKLIWKSIPRLEFSSQQFKSLPKFAKFVTHVLTHRNRQVEVTSVKLWFHGAASQVFVRKIADYAFSHNVQELTVISWPKNHHVYPPCLFSSQTLKQLSLKGQFFGPCITPKTPWDFPSLTTLYLHDTMLCDNYNESVDLFSKCLNLTNLALESCIIQAKVFDIRTPRLSALKLNDCTSGDINVIAPLLENLSVIKSSIHNIEAPLRLSYLHYSGYHHPGYHHPQWFKNCFHSLNEVIVSLSIHEKNKPYEEPAARETINMLQELRSARRLTLNMDIVECISSFPDLLSHLPSPFSNLISLNINSDMRSDAYKVELPTEARNFLLENSPSATFIMDLPEPPPTKAMKAKEARAKKAKLLADIHNYMKELQTSLEQGNVLFNERKLALEEKKTTVEHHMTVLQLTQTVRDSAQSEEIVAGLKAQIVACLVEILDMLSQDIDEAFTFSSKRAHIISLLEALPERQMTEMEGRYTHQLKEIGTLCDSLHSARRDLFSYVEKNIEALKEYNFDKMSPIHDDSVSEVLLASQPSSSSAAPPPTNAMEAIEAMENMKAKLVADIESHMKELQASNQEGNINLVEKKQVRRKTKATLEDHVVELKVLSNTIHSKLERVKSDDVEGLIAQIKARLGEMHDLAKQCFEATTAILKKKYRIEYLLEMLRELQSEEVNAGYSHPLEEAKSLGRHLFLEFYLSEKVIDDIERMVCDCLSVYQDFSVANFLCYHNYRRHLQKLVMLLHPPASSVNPMP